MLSPPRRKLLIRMAVILVIALLSAGVIRLLAADSSFAAGNLTLELTGKAIANTLTVARA